MTTLTAYRPRHRVGRTAPEAARPAPSPDLIAWSTDGDRAWQGRIELLDAGTITLGEAGYAVTTWDGQPEGVYRTLAEAQRSLEPAHRARLRDEAEAGRGGPLRAVAAVVGVSALAATAAAGLLVTLPL